MPLDEPVYPVNLRLAGRRCLVVGGGKVAKGKVEGLLAAGAEVTVVAPEVSDDIAVLEGVTVQRRAYRRGDVKEFRLVIAATDDPAVNKAVYDDAEAAGVLVNSADDPDNCAFILPAVVRRGPITVAIGTGGHSPALARWLRHRIGGELGPEYEELLAILTEVREEMRRRGEPTEVGGWQNALDSGMLELIRAGRHADAKERLLMCLSSS